MIRAFSMVFCFVTVMLGALPSRAAPMLEGQLCEQQAAGLARDGKNSQALEIVRACLERDGATLNARILLGKLLLAGNELDKALDAFDQALRLDPASSSAKIGKAMVLSRQGKLDAAEQLLQQALTLAPDPTRVYFELGRIHEQRGDSRKALAAYKEGIKIHEQKDARTYEKMSP